MKQINNRQKMNVRPAHRIDKNLLAAQQLKREVARKIMRREKAKRSS